MAPIRYLSSLLLYLVLDCPVPYIAGSCCVWEQDLLLDPVLLYWILLYFVLDGSRPRCVHMAPGGNRSFTAFNPY